MSKYRNALPSQADWTQHQRALHANSSCKSHIELDEVNPAELGQQ